MVFDEDSSIFCPMTKAYETIVIQPKGGVFAVGLNRPQAANALNLKMGTELAQVFSAITKNKKSRAVIVFGQGRHFCAGADLKERKGMDEAAWHKQHAAFEKARDAILKCPVPVIAAVSGAAFGGGLELALACDFIYAADDATFGLTEATLGIMPGMGGTQTLSRRIGIARAKERMFTGQRISAKQAHDMGLANALVARGKLLDAAFTCAQQIAASAPLSVRAIKQAVNEGAALSLDKAVALELKHYNTLLKTKDRHEGINAFNEKRRPKFTGE